MKRRVFVVLFLVVFSLNLVIAINATSSTYTIGSFHAGSAGSNGTSSTYSIIATTTYEQGSSNASSSTYSFFSRWFKPPTIVETPAEKSAKDTGTTTTTAGGGGGGGGGGGAVYTPVSQLGVVPVSFNLPAVTGIEKVAKITIINLGNENLDIRINTVNLDGIVNFNQNGLVLPAREERTLEFIVTPPEPGIYTGRILFSSGSQTTSIPFTLNVNSEGALFDIFVDLAQEFRRIVEGNKITAQITLVQAGVQQEEDVSMNYLVKDFDGKTYLDQSETIAVFREKTYEKEFGTENLPPGDYVIGAQVIYSGGVATASSQFTVERLGEIPLILIAEVILTLAMLIGLIGLAINYKRKRNMIKK